MNIENLLSERNNILEQELKNQQANNTKALLIITDLNESLSKLTSDDVSIDLNNTNSNELLKIAVDLILLCKEIKDDNL